MTAVSKPKYLLIMKTNEGHIIKNLTELLQHNLKNVCYTFKEDGVHLRMTDSNNKILFDLFLPSDNFVRYKIKGEFQIGLNQGHLHKMLKSTKKRDSVNLFIKEDAPNDLQIQVIPKDKSRTTTSVVKIQNIQNIDMDLPEGYKKPVLIPSSEYQKMCKEMNTIGKTITVSSKKESISFSCSGEGVYSRNVNFGEGKSNKILITQEFDKEQLARISKISGLGSNTNIKIYQKDGLPLLFTTSVGSLGQLSIYVKSKKQIEDSESVVDDE